MQCQHGKDKDSGEEVWEDSCAVCLTGTGRKQSSVAAAQEMQWYQEHILPRSLGFGAPDAWAMLGQLMED